MRGIVHVAWLLLAGCASIPPVALAPAPEVTAAAETRPVETVAADAADDPAIWRDQVAPARSLIVATDKKAGLYVYGLDGEVRHFDPAGRLNNVDLIELEGAGVIVVASDRNDLAAAQLRIYRLDTDTARLVSLGSVPGGPGEAYGVCLTQEGGRLTAFSVLKAGDVHQIDIDISGTQPSGVVRRSLKLASQTEGCVVDSRSHTLFVGEEDRGIWAFDSRATASATGSLVAAVDGKQLVADVEGLALVAAGSDGGWLVASSQGDNAYALFSLPGLTPAGRFRIAAGRFGAAEETDGIALVSGDFGPRYPAGLFVAQDGQNEPSAQNFKLVSWAEVLTAIGALTQPR